jgi:hypothetical protein
MPRIRIRRSRAPLSLAVLAALLGGLATPARARAQPAAKPAADPAKLEAQEKQAKQACDGGRAAEGARLLTELLNQTNDGTYIFNMARCYQQNGQLEQALLHFRSYLRRSDVDPAAAAKAREYVAVLERPQPTPPAAAASTAPTPAVAGAPEVSASASSKTGSPGRTLRIGGLVAAAAGVVSLAAGTYYTLETWKLNDETERAQRAMNQGPDWFKAQNEKGERAERRQWLFLGTGATLVAAGGVLYYLGVRAGHRPDDRQDGTMVVLSPLPGDAGAMAILNGRF